MALSLSNLSRHHEQWSKDDLEELRQRVIAGESDKIIAVALGRSEASISSQRYYRKLPTRYKLRAHSQMISSLLGDTGYWENIREATNLHSKSLGDCCFEDEPV